MKKYILFILLQLTLVLSGCVNEAIPENPELPPTNNGEMVTINLPGYIGIKILNTASTSSRGDDSQNPSSGDSFHDGDPSEYALAPGEGYHYVILYKKNSNQSPAAIIPITITDEDINYDDDRDQNGNITYDNLTLTVNKIIMSSAFASDNSFKDIEAIKTFLEDTEAYFILNFDKQIIDTSAESSPSTGTSTPSTIDILNNLSLTALKNLYLKDWKITVSNNGETVDYFTMSNSVYANNDGTDILFSNSVNKANVFENQDLAKKSPAISAYVERLAVKYTVDFGELLTVENNLKENIKVQVYAGKVEYTENGYIIQSEEADAIVKIIGVGIGGIEKNSRLFKNLSPSKSYYTYWNDYDNNRSYWTEDGHYLLSSETLKGYPHQFRQALETDTVRNVHIGGDAAYTDFQHDGIYVSNVGTINTLEEFWNSDIILNYTKFKDINGMLNTTPFYSMENTYSDPGMKGETWIWPWNKVPYSAATHLLVAAQIQQIRHASLGTNPYPDNQEPLYKGQNNIFYTSKESLLTSKLEIFNTILLSGGNTDIRVLHALFDLHKPYSEANYPGESSNVESDELNQKLYKLGWNVDSKLWFAHKNESGNYTDTDGTKWNVWEAEYSNLDLIQAEISGGDGQMLIAPANTYTGADFKYFIAPRAIGDEGNYEMEGDAYKMDDNKKVEINYHHLVALFHKIIGPIDVFTDGYMYYAVPIPHNVSVYGDDSWKNLGDVGVVRNNWYNISIEQISDIGTPVQDIDQPIVPVMDVRRSYINLAVKLLQWHEVDQGNVPMQ